MTRNKTTETAKSKHFTAEEDIDITLDLSNDFVRCIDKYTLKKNITVFQVLCALAIAAKEIISTIAGGSGLTIKKVKQTYISSLEKLFDASEPDKPKPTKTHNPC